MKRLVLLASLALAACTVGPNYKKPAVPVPDQFYGAIETSEESLGDAKWFDVFGDPVLRSLIEEAERNGYDARIAITRVEEARARYGIAGAARFPEVDAQVRGGWGHASGDTGTAITANVAAGWELDLWGRIRRLNEAARAQYLASEEGERAVRLALLSEVASAYFDLRELDEELRIARHSVETFQSTFDLFNRRLQGGTASAVETSRASALLANAQAQIPLIESDIIATENELNVLLGRVPGPIERGTSLSQQAIPVDVPAGLPSALLLRRPDVRAAEQELIAANANIGVAEAAFYPTVSLSALLSDGPVYRVEAGLLAPIFNGGRLRNQRRVAVAQFQRALAEYEQSVTGALADVSTTLVALDKLRVAEEERTRALRANEEAARLVYLRYNSGLSAYFEVLDALQQTFIAENALARTRRDRLVALVRFYRALGGGF
ncbi:MAG TPA: efflux transporter outer membrane subunit [Thermoanaerobaculia bacterium]|nr:efflux transporter outer membrane subunit [Thermoanaerobaculia bacterium]